MSSLPPHLPHAPPPLDPQAPPRFLFPLLKSVLVVLAASAVCWLVTIPLVAVLANAAWLQDLLQGQSLEWLPPSLHWLGRHAVSISVAMLLLCLLGVAGAWGMLKRQRWALWLLIGVLVFTALLNFVGVWVVDDIFSHLHTMVSNHPLDSPDMRQLRQEMQINRILWGGIAVVTTLAFAGLHGWVVVRLLKPDVQRWFARVPTPGGQ